MYKIAAIQMHALPKQPEANTATCIKMAQEAAQLGADLIVLPELWISGYYLSKSEFQEMAESPTGKTVTRFRELSKKLGVVMVVPFVEEDGEELYISLAVIEKSGELLTSFRKSFLWGREKAIFTPGKREYRVIETSLGLIGVLICADIEFPEPSRILALQGAEVIICPSVWSIPAENRWDIQLPARGLDNTVFVLGVNTVNEGSCGKSKLVAPNGEILCVAPRDEPYILLHDIDLSLISKARTDVPYLSDLDKSLIPGLSKVEIHEP
ncbi:putative amidohydrolase [Scopulibacillus darangshiensis]|uniref:Putative amidohydrolase n=1 Tax=Scopulibacillus darangshiensis TaxID=442528 RepID=A0A4R2P4X5_9BACL|nr:nitrilase-related carbon-nitrogen hydrolase [Scopulibacillus darangshiensis]TCP29001.1 putative amidohydrolase [Scopulibacillus darangshiensis]